MHDDDAITDAMEELELYVLDLLDDDERAKLEARIAADLGLQDRVRELRGTAGVLAFALEPMEPPAGLRGRILDEARSDVIALEPVQFPDPASRISPWTLAAAAVLAIAFLAVLAYISFGGPTGDVRTFSVAVTDASDASVTGETRLREGAREATIQLQGLAMPPAGQVYQVWLVASDEAPVPSVTFLPGANGEAGLLIRGDLPATELVAITLEPEGGSPAPTTDILLVSDLTGSDTI